MISLKTQILALENSLRREWLDSYIGVRYTLKFLFLSDVEAAEEQLLQALLMRKLNRDAVDKRGTAWRFGKREDDSNLLQGVKDLLSKAAAGDKDDTDAAHGDYDSYKEDQLLRYLGHDEVGYNNKAEEKRGSAWRFGQVILSIIVLNSNEPNYKLLHIKVASR